MSTSKLKAPLLLSTIDAIYIIDKLVCVLLCEHYITAACKTALTGVFVLLIVACLVSQHTLHHSPCNAFVEVFPCPMEVSAYCTSLPIEAL